MFDNWNWYGDWPEKKREDKMSKKDKRLTHTFAFISQAEKSVLEALAWEHRGTVEFEFSTKEASTQSCVIKSTDENRIKWIVFLVDKIKDRYRKLNGSLYASPKEQPSPPLNPVTDDDFEDILRIARRILDP